MRLDKFLCETDMGTRSQVKDAVRSGRVSVNGVVIKRPDFKIDEHSDTVLYGGMPCVYRRFVYLLLNKPAGVVSAVRDKLSETVVDLLGVDAPKDIFPVGRLDKDTEGLLLLTNDGALAHKLLSPSKHVDKTYLVGLRGPLGEEEKAALEQGVDIGEKRKTLPAGVERAGEDHILLTIREGKFHQVKRMLLAVGNEVVSLKRVSFGGLRLDENLAPGHYRELTDQEITVLRDGRTGDNTEI